MSFILAVSFTKCFFFLKNRHKICLNDAFSSKMLNLWPRSAKVKTIFTGLLVWQIIKTPFDSCHSCGVKLITSAFVILSWNILINGFKLKVCMLDNIKNMGYLKLNILRGAWGENGYLSVY